MRNKFADAIYEIGSKDASICVLVADISPAGSMVYFREKFPERFVNTGVAEQSMIGIAAGLALNGMRPFCYTIATFSLFRPFEMIRVDLAYQNLPVTVIGMGAGVIYSTLGSTHHTMEDISIASAVPNLKVLAPCDPLEMAEATRWCATSSDGPVYMRLGKAGEPDLTGKLSSRFKVGKIRLIREGDDIVLLSYGTILKKVLEVAEALEKFGKSVAVVNVHTLKPVDKKGLSAILKKFSKVIVVEEHVGHGGLSSKVKELAYECQSDAVIKAFHLQDEFIHFYGSYDGLLEKHGISVERIISCGKALFNG